MELIVVHDDVGVVGWLGGGEVKLMRGDVAVETGSGADESDEVGCAHGSLAGPGLDEQRTTWVLHRRRVDLRIVHRVIKDPAAPVVWAHRGGIRPRPTTQAVTVSWSNAST